MSFALFMLNLAKRGMRSLTVLAVAAALLVPVVSVAVAQEGTPPPGGSEVAAELPPVDLPTMNEQSFTFELTSSFAGSLDTTPQEAPVFQMTLQEVDLERARQIATQLGVQGEVTERGTGIFAAEGNGSVYFAPGLIQYVSPTAAPTGELPADDAAIAYAKEWLRQVGLLPADIGDGEVRSRLEEPGRVVVVFKPVTPQALLSDLPSISVTLGPAGTILDASVRWAELAQGDVYQLRPPDQAWDDVAGMRAYLQTTLPDDEYPQGSTITGTAEYEEVTIAYTSSGIPGEQQYLQPVFVYTGRITPEGSEDSFPITAYVPALANSQQPVG
ncbi:MAG: hypothetical protein M3121_08300 [Chloroflexota bacterium]|nr:hypothetical protein [Chloroflexota bacterium]